MTVPDDPLAEWGIPDDWSRAARELFAGVIAERPELGGADLGALEHAASLTSAAEHLDAVARKAGMTALGSTGQTVVHPAVVEARLARTSAATILARLAPSTSERYAARGRSAAKTRHQRSP